MGFIYANLQKPPDETVKSSRNPDRGSILLNSTPYSTSSGSNPFSIAVADFNNDNQVDIAIGYQQNNNVMIFNGYRYKTFAGQITYPTAINSSPTTITSYPLGNLVYPTGVGSRPNSVAVADFNTDGQLDMAVANYGMDNVGVLLGYGHGNFSNQIIHPTGVGSRSASVAVGDFNNDRQLDITVANLGMNNVGVFLRYGDGNFSSQIMYPTGVGSYPASVAVGDFTDDGRLDIAVANNRMNNVGVFLGYGDGNLSSQIIYPTGCSSHPNSIAVGDFNSDGRLDIAVANYGADNVGVFLWYGDGNFSSQMTYSTDVASNPASVAVGDFNNDNRLDIAVANYFTHNIGVFLGYGDGTFRIQTTFSSGVFSYPLTVAVGDFNDDSNLDIAVGNSATREENIFILLGNGNGNFSNNGKYQTGLNSMPSSVVVGNFDNDSRLDIAVGNKGTNNLGIFLGYGNGTFSTQTTYPTNDGSNPTSIAVGDFTDDNQTDIIVANYGTFTVGVFLACNTTSFESKTTWSPSQVNNGKMVIKMHFYL